MLRSLLQSPFVDDRGSYDYAFHMRGRGGLLESADVVSNVNITITTVIYHRMTLPLNN